MTRYASETTVPAEKSRMEIEQTLRRYGADSFMYGWDDEKAGVRFRAHGKFVAFVLPMPAKNADEFKWVQYAREYSPRRRTDKQAEAAWEQSVRQRWRALSLVIKAKLEAVESGITTFEDEFLAHLLMPDGSTLGEWAKPQVEEAYATGIMPSRLLGLPAPKNNVTTEAVP